MNPARSTNRLLVAALLLVLVFPLRAQILVGPAIGGQVTFLSFGDKDNLNLYKTSPYFGFHAGASVSFRVHKNFFLQTSLLYSQKGKKIEGKVDQELRNSATYKYIEMPILFTKEVKLKFGQDKYYKVHLGVGPMVSYWLSGKGKLTNSDLDENGINPPDYILPYHVTFIKEPDAIANDQMNVQTPNRLQLGLNFSAGFILEPDRFNRMMFTLQYCLGHSYLSVDSDGDFGYPGILFYKDELSTRFHTLSFSVFYFVDLKTETRKKGKSTLKKK